MDRTEGLEKQTNHMMEINDSHHELIENDNEIPADDCPWSHLEVPYKNSTTNLKKTFNHH